MRGVDTVFGFQGGNVTHIIDSVYRNENIRYVQTYHEQAAAFAACAYAQVKRGIGVAVASSGPGATNMITGIANAYYDSVPCVFVTGNVNTAVMRKSNEIRQNAFQEADIVSMVKSITKYAATISDGGEIPSVIEEAYNKAMTGRKGPVLLDIPHNIQRENIPITNISVQKSFNKLSEVSTENMQRVKSVLEKAQKPLMLFGGGLHNVERFLIKRFVEKPHCPIVASLCGLDVISHNTPGFLGFIGSYGKKIGNQALAECDVLFVLGSRLDERQIDAVRVTAKVIHIDIDPNELNRALKEDVSICADLNVFITQLLKTDIIFSGNQINWHNKLSSFEEDETNKNETELFFSENIGQWFNAYIQNDDIICGDVGISQMGLAREIYLTDNRLLNSAGLGSMGYALPAAVGAHFANSSARILCFAGDGGIQMNIQEFETIIREKLPIKIIIVNNNSLGMVRNYQKLAFEGRYPGTVWGYSVPDFKKIAQAYGLCYYSAKEPLRLKEAIPWLSGRENGVLEIFCKE